MVPINTPRVAVIGCGWLGMPLAIHLLEQGYEVHGTTTHPEKLSLLNKRGIKGYQLELPIITSDRANKALWSCDTYIINIPPGRRNPKYAAEYPQRIKALFQTISTNAEDPRIIFVSSTGVYANSGSTVNESSTLVPKKDSVLLQAENLLTNLDIKSVILRMAGLAGPGRHPGKWFAGRVNVPGGNTPINMVHQSDCIEVISCLIKDQEITGVYNVCADEHPMKKEFYDRMSKKIEVVPPTFQEGLVPFKIVDNQKLKERLGFRYRFSDPMLFSY